MSHLPKCDSAERAFWELRGGQCTCDLLIVRGLWEGEIRQVETKKRGTEKKGENEKDRQTNKKGLKRKITEETDEKEKPSAGGGPGQSDGTRRSGDYNPQHPLRRLPPGVSLLGNPVNKMAASGRAPPWSKPVSLQSSLQLGAQSIPLRSEKERQPYWSFPMGQRTNDVFHGSSSYLLQQLIHRDQESEAEEVESEESSESEMLNLEVCFSPHSFSPTPSSAVKPGYLNGGSPAQLSAALD
ncbi:Leucine-rich repeat and guanylate kinase domain-containing protein [Tupaia chinensis]|uniref:Leucine-rich repeat and guanylate kinase domain-containing protein n=1 Tax=Tupaia chinensis TaxID=246437 RepID=L9L1E3_TUPCH|nr:Leucine-rich repeat and guanylate kinase domain-containing protein [Tupaia chinensis]